MSALACSLDGVSGGGWEIVVWIMLCTVVVCALACAGVLALVIWWLVRRWWKR
jgi:hypothetical protein